jgi:hypothetical protein
MSTVTGVAQSLYTDYASSSRNLTQHLRQLGKSSASRVHRALIHRALSARGITGPEVFKLCFTQDLLSSTYVWDRETCSSVRVHLGYGAG